MKSLVDVLLVIVAIAALIFAIYEFYGFVNGKDTGFTRNLLEGNRRLRGDVRLRAGRLHAPLGRGRGDTHHAVKGADRTLLSRARPHARAPARDAGRRHRSAPHHDLRHRRASHALLQYEGRATPHAFTAPAA
jgi:hypothetical protein